MKTNTTLAITSIGTALQIGQQLKAKTQTNSTSVSLVRFNFLRAQDQQTQIIANTRITTVIAMARDATPWNG